jgi:hypothetical protein
VEYPLLASTLQDNFNHNFNYDFSNILWLWYIFHLTIDSTTVPKRVANIVKWNDISNNCFVWIICDVLYLYKHNTTLKYMLFQILRLCYAHSYNTGYHYKERNAKGSLTLYIYIYIYIYSVQLSSTQKLYLLKKSFYRQFGTMVNKLICNHGWSVNVTAELWWIN